MYDVRGIQNYIFRTNKIKEIIGASKIVEELIMNLFNESSKEYTVLNTINSKDELKSFDDDTIDAEVLYYGGGNLLVLYKNDEIAKKVSRKMCLKLVEDTYSLQLAVASVDVTGKDSYKKDYANLRIEMEKQKLKMPMVTPVNGFPITLNDPQTGFAFSKIYDKQKVTWEAFKKLTKYDAYRKAELNENREIENVNEFGSEDGESLIAIVHIDGNSMGNKIKEKMEEVTTYVEAAKTSRNISSEIQNTFKNIALKKVTDNIKNFCNLADIKDKDRKSAFRTIIHAGDDITFICNARIALNCVNTFMQALHNNPGKILGEYHTCAGIFITHTHFPFARGYELAEQLCANAKKKSREKDGNYIDFQLNTSGILSDIEHLRDKQYQDSLGNPLAGRPYHLGESNTKLCYELNDLLKMLEKIKKTNVARTQIKSLREAFLDGEEIVKQELARINSRLKKENKIEINNNYQILFDAIDIMDLKWGEIYGDEEKTSD